MAVAVSLRVAALVPPGWATRLINADEPDARYRGDAFVAVHADGSHNTSARGASVGYQTAEGQALAARWKQAYASLGFPSHFRADNYTSDLSGYYGVRKAVAQGNRAAIIIEAGFLTNPTERAWIAANHDTIARSIWAAVAPGAKEEAVTTTPYRIVTAEAATAEHRAELIRMCQRLGMAHAALGRSLTFHGHIDRVREVEAYIAANAAHVKRTHGVMVAAGTHQPLNQTLPHGAFTADAAYAAGSSAAYDELSAAVRDAIAELSKLV